MVKILTVNEIQARLLAMSDEGNAAFQRKLTPGEIKGGFLGVRMPHIRKLAAEILKQNGADAFLADLPHVYFDEYLLHAVLISGIKDFEKAAEYTNAFLPYVDNWAVCDALRPVVFRKHRAELWDMIKLWCATGDTYTVRFGIEMLMLHFLDADFRYECLEIPAAIKSGEYYVDMMIAWFYATALAIRWDDAIGYIESGQLSKWTHNKAIQKSIESFRVTDEHKAYLRSLRR